MCVLVATGASCGRGFVVVGVTVLCLSEEKYLFLPVISTLFRDLDTKYAARFMGAIASVICSTRVVSSICAISFISVACV